MSQKKIILYFIGVTFIVFLFTENFAFAAESSTNTSETPNTTTTSSLNTVESTIDSATEPTTIETTNNDNEKTTESLSTYDAVALTDDTPDGSQTNPFLVSNESELVTALAATPAGEGDLYIKLTADITGTDWRSKFQFIRNTVLDGDGHSFLFQGTNYTAYQFYVQNTPNLTVTYKNLNFGNQDYPNSNYYGIMHTIGSTSTNFTLNIENVNYYVINGAQPFNFSAANSSINFSGTNNFQMPSASGTGGEFTEGVQNITVKQGSHTTINHLNNQETNFFRGNNNAGQMNLTVEDDATLDIQSIKRYMFNASPQPQVTVGQNATLKYSRINATTTLALNYNSSGVTFNFSPGSIGVFQNQGKIDTGTNASNFVVNANEPDYVIFRDTSTNGSGSFLASTSSKVIFNRTDTSEGKSYSLLGLGRDNQISTLNDFPISSTYSLLGSAVANHSGVIYQEDLSIADSVIATSNTSSSDSSIDAYIEKVEPSGRELTNVRYKLATKQLFSESQSITDSAAQTAITNATTGTDGFLQQKDQTITDSTSDNFDIKTATTGTVENLAPGTYYLYTQLSEIIGNEEGDTSIPGFSLTSKWVEQQVTVNSVINVSFPVEALTFNSPKTGTFGKNENKNGGAKISSNSNVPIGVKLQSVQENTDNTIKLVDTFTSTPNQELILRLNSSYDSSGATGPTWGPLKQNYTDTQELSFLPFWEGNTEATIFLDGDYSGPSGKQQKVNYQFIFYYEDLSQ